MFSVFQVNEEFMNTKSLKKYDISFFGIVMAVTCTCCSPFKSKELNAKIKKQNKTKNQTKKTNPQKNHRHTKPKPTHIYFLR